MAVERSPAGATPRVGLVLGAGGVRGCAHGGVARVLHEAQVPIDLVVGASIGAMFGLGVAAGLDPDYISRVARAARPVDVFRFYADRLRATRSNPIGRMLLEAGDGKTFADLPLPFAVTVTDMETGRPAVIDSGPVLPAIQASIALPLIARPVAHGPRWCLDGGLFDTAPVGVARAMGADRVIAVCLGHNFHAPKFLRRRPWTNSILERAGRQRGPIEARLRDQICFTLRLYAASFNPPAPAQDADVAIWPEFGRIGPNSMIGAAFCHDQGVRATRDALPAIERMLSGIASR